MDMFEYGKNANSSKRRKIRWKNAQCSGRKYIWVATQEDYFGFIYVNIKKNWIL